MFYLVYRITNRINGKFYIGTHKTENIDDGYMGSGKMIRYAIEKYGIAAFDKEILFECATSEEMFDKERELVVVDPTISYNLRIGGDGGFSYIHEHGLSGDWRELWKNDAEWRENYRKALSKGMKKYYANGGKNPFQGKKHTTATKKAVGKASSLRESGEGNSQYGTMWIRNPITLENRRVKKCNPIPDGWIKGRKIKH
jgi:hypothetical protein